MKLLILSADGFEDLELFYPYHRLSEEHEVEIASNKVNLTSSHWLESHGIPYKEV